VPDSTGLRPARPTSTQEAFGRILVGLSRGDSVSPYLVTTAPDVATSTNLAGFINRKGVFSPAPRRSWSEDAVLKWSEGPEGQHIELGISSRARVGRASENEVPLVPTYCFPDTARSL